MTGKELLLNALHNKKTDKTPWVPFVGCHAASLINKTATEFLKSKELMVDGVGKAIEKYKPDGIPVAFDLQIEAEILGCQLNWADDNPPAVTTHPLAEGVTLDELKIPGPGDGRFPVVLDATRELVAKHPDVAFYGLITGPFTLALHLLGPNIFMAMYDDVEGIKKIMEFCKDVAVKAAEYYIEAGCDIVAIVDPMTSQIGPDHFAEFVTPYVTPIFDAIREKGKLSSFFVCGHAQANIEEMCKTGPDNISIDENIQLAYVKEICQKYDISFGGNMQLTIVLLFGTTDDCMRNAMDCMTVGGNKGFILAPGCDIPYATPPENLEIVAQLVNDPYQQEIAKTIAIKQSDPEKNLDMSDYGKLDKVVIDVITLDSEACAPCQYMVESVKAVVPEFEDLVIWREHKIKEPDSVDFMTGMMVRNIPTICIDGEIVFVSRIPARDEMISAIQNQINKKLRRNLKRYSGEIILLGGGCDACEETKKNIDKAVKELGVQLPVNVVSDDEQIAAFGVESTPAIVTVQKSVKSSGIIPKVEVIKEWIKDLRL